MANSDSERTINDDVDVLGRCLGTVLKEQEGERFFALEEQVRQETKRLREGGLDSAPMQAVLAAVSLDDAERLVHAFSSYFLLINLAEEHGRLRRVASITGPRKQELEQALVLLRDEGHTAATVRALIASCELGLTFTAHPTEMRRRTVRGHLEAISNLVPSLGTPEAVEQLTAHVEALWSTPQLRDRHPTVRDEVNAGLAYIEVIASVLPELERELERSFERVFNEPASLELPLSFHSWMGGDRDGNPTVTPQVTRDTFALHAERARAALSKEIDAAYGWLSQSTRQAHSVVDEPFRRTLQAMHDALETPGVELAPKMGELDAALASAGQARSRERFGRPLQVRSRVFGVHLASLDIREHSALTGKAVGELLKTIGVETYEKLPEAEKSALLRRELQTRRPLRPAGETGSEALENVLGPMQAAREAIARAGPRAFGVYIISMSEHPSDLLEVLILAREVGLDVVPVPLFETLGDLERAPAVMRAVLAMPEYRAVLRDRVQEVMIGYSDSNKDAGFVAANWALYQAQANLAAVFTEAGVRHRFFHGRGTSIGRGGGPMVRGMLGQPEGTMGAGMRITEQGEALRDKYSHPALAKRNLEQGLHGLLVAAGRKPKALDPAWPAALERAAVASVEAYRGLVRHPDFLPFFEAVTPIREISKLRIASRPVRRPGAATLSNLRAIPWVMAWTQCRANVPGWYGLGDALGVLGQPLAKEMYERWPFFRSMLDNAQMALAKSDLLVFRAYRGLSTEKVLGDRVEAAFQRTSALVRGVVGGEVLVNEPRLLSSINLRNPYIEPIHRVQVELLRRARAYGDDEALPEALERSLVLSLH
ncbi:MAG: phosphoenolpyruvate carboxylase, partial [Archangium sp.]|nr:phosphoenolpyruvate carboxylase [Archangium sp.]